MAFISQAKKKYGIFLFLSIVLNSSLIAQNNVGMGTTTPDPSAILDLTSKDKGLLVPRMTTVERTTLILSPANALLVYDTDLNCFFYRKAGAWKSLCDDGVPVGGIIMWSGTLATIPSGWALCDGTLGTPNLMDKFILSVLPAEDPGATGGNHNQSISVANLPAHDHAMNHTHTITDPGHTHSMEYRDCGSGVNWPTYDSDTGCQNYFNTASSTTGITIDNYSGNTSTTGSGSTFDNRPAYYKLAFIMKL